MCFQGDEAEPYLEMQGTVLSVPGLDRVDDLAHRLFDDSSDEANTTY